MVQPLAPDLTQVTSWCFALDGAPDEMTRLTLRFLTAAASPASLVAADDLEVFERCQRGFAGLGPEWLDISRGVLRDRESDSEWLAPGTSEMPMTTAHSRGEGKCVLKIGCRNGTATTRNNNTSESPTAYCM